MHHFYPLRVRKGERKWVYMILDCPRTISSFSQCGVLSVVDPTGQPKLYAVETERRDSRLFLYTKPDADEEVGGYVFPDLFVRLKSENPGIAVVENFDESQCMVPGIFATSQLSKTTIAGELSNEEGTQLMKLWKTGFSKYLEHLQLD
jgi:hypothetical protein